MKPDGRHASEPFRVKVVDRTGAGDSFRAGIVYGLLQCWPAVECVRFACATAALICTWAPGGVRPSTLDEVRQLRSASR